ncbi:hypothetical protein FACS189434_04120 [Bacteroidia bacterium]|nr:hypothetical protein FACS189434_04120 [Bacteroidia bacterium]
MVKINNYKITILSLLLMVMTGCPEPGPELDGYIRIINNSEEDIVWCAYVEGRDLESSRFYWGNNMGEDIILKDTIRIDYFNCDAVKHTLERGWMKYYLFNLDSIQTISWERICNERIILKEVTFHSWEEMVACGFTITYP